MFGVGKKMVNVEVERPTNKDPGVGGARTYGLMEEYPGCGKKADKGVRGLPAVPAPATGGDSAMHRSREAMQSPGGMTVSSCEEPYARHPLQGFDDLLKAFDGFIDASEGGTRIVDHGQPGKSDKNIKRNVAMAPVDPYTRRQFPLATPDNDGNWLPRLYSRSSSAPVGPSWFQKRPRTEAKRRRMSRAQPAKEFSPLLRHQSPPLEPEHVRNSLQDADPFELMLRSKANRRPDLEGLGIQPGLAIQLSQDDFDTSSGEGAAGIGYGVSKATPGVFRLTHTGTGFVHYGYSWDIAGAKEDQLRRLRIACSDDINCNNNSGAPHPHRGLSAVVRGQQEKQPRNVEQLESEGARDNNFKAVSNGEMRQLRFEVVRLVPLPTRFRASDFEETMRQACEQELLDRRAHLLVLVARQYQRNHVGPAFVRVLLACRSDGDDEKCAAAAEVQRVWRGFSARNSARRTREIECRDRLANELARVRAILAGWGQSMHRGNMGRRRARGLRDDRVQAATCEKKALAAAAVSVQDWVRCLYKRRKLAEAAADKAEVDALLRAIRLEKEATNELPPKGAMSRGSKRPINSPEARLARGPRDEDTQASLAGASGWSGATPTGSTGDNISPAGSSSSSRGQQRRRPSSSRESRLGSTTRSRGDNDDGSPQEFPHPPPKKQRGDTRPASAPRLNQMAGISGRPPRDDSASAAPPTGIVPAAIIPDASRLVLEGDPRFTAATAIQAAWRGFTARLGIRKRRRAEAALRRKREGKWRQQRGVVGKRMSVAWDERRGLEEGGGGGNGGGGTVSCIEIQVHLRDDGGVRGAGMVFAPWVQGRSARERHCRQ